uniref:RNA-directed DNA polymerase, eukaryota n=1 Tax=Tanacetum cinerariifolium TaxID=118510 RepID=A0A6L2MVY3_TANCI|nr:RNA-directed DNA polymerase, eukaryota [Tanacetum cinerariifolium]
MSGAHPSKKSNHNNLQDVTETMFITNFPTSFGSKDLWKTCNEHGSVADVYIALKLSIIGRRFAFVRFLKVKNTESLLVDLNKIWIGSYHLFAAMTRFDRKPKDSSKPLPKPNHTNNQPKHAFQSSHVNPNRSYATALNGKISPNQVPKEILKSVYVDASDLIEIHDMKNVILVKARDIDERVVWIEIGGLLLNAWTPKAFKKIACSWGEPLFLDDDPNKSVALGRVCIRSKIHGHINETCKVLIHDKAHNVRVKEFAGWVPDIEAMDTRSEKKSDVEIPEEQDNIIDDHDSLNVEEGEIQEKKETEEVNAANSHNFSWAEESGNADKDHLVASPINLSMKSKNHSTTESPKAPRGDSETFSKPPGYENFKHQNKHNSQHSSSSCPGAKSSRASKPLSIAFSNHGSMIEALVSQIEMGKVLGYDMEGSTNDLKKLIEGIGAKHETHSLSIDPFKVKSLWGNFQFDFTICPSVGRFGGLLSVWDTNSFSKNSVFAFDHFLIVEGNWLHSHLHCFMVNVYAPQDDGNKEILWNSILEFKEEHSGHYIIFGDFNVVRFALKRFGTMFNSSSGNAFNQFIINGSLWEFPHGGHLFTYINRRGNKLSKLDRFLITEDSTSLMRNHSALVLDCHISDHRPIFLTAATVNFGPSPFKLYNSWLLDSWLESLYNIEQEEQLDISQQAKVKWGVWLTDPTKIKDAFLSVFEAKFKKKEVDKIAVRSQFYKSLQEDQNSFLISPTFDVENMLLFVTVAWKNRPEFLNSSIMPKGCNTSFVSLIPKISNPTVVSDFRSISLIGAKYKIIAKLLANRLAKVIDSVSSREQTAFVKHRQILDGPLMVNEVIKWCNRKRDKLMIFQIDFEKAFDFVYWDFLFQVMHLMGFSDKWISWINGCLSHATASILVNGSPTREYHINHGIRQGDPLSPFLFIIAIEGLHVAVEDAISAGLYRGIKINTLTLSYFFFADDALFIGEWSRDNIRNMTTILECFHRVSGLKINFHKSNLVGIRIPFEEDKILSQITGCHASHSSFTYLGLPVGCNMAVTKS